MYIQCRTLWENCGYMYIQCRTLWENCGRTVGELWENCGRTVGELWEGETIFTSPLKAAGPPCLNTNNSYLKTIL